MIPLEREALEALQAVSMRLGSSGKRFRNDLVSECCFLASKDMPEPKLTERQALYLWFLVDMYRRQIKNTVLLELGAERRLTGELPDIYLPGDLRPPINRNKPAKRARKSQQESIAAKLSEQLELLD